jgi:hypothetical protein
MFPVMGSQQVASPVQVVIIGFDGPAIPDEVRAAVADLPGRQDVRLVDALGLSRDRDGSIRRHDLPDLRPDEPSLRGALHKLLDEARSRPVLEDATLSGAPRQDRGVLFKVDGLSDPRDVLPHGSNAVGLLLEHRWGAQLRGAVAHAGAYRLPVRLAAQAVDQLGLPGSV